jgi:hypothetical protein
MGLLSPGLQHDGIATMTILTALKPRMAFVVMLTAAGLFFGGFAHGYGLQFGAWPNDCEGE